MKDKDQQIAEVTTIASDMRTRVIQHFSMTAPNNDHAIAFKAALISLIDICEIFSLTSIKNSNS